MYPIAARLILIVSMLMSLQASAGMLMEPGTKMKGTCADMDMGAMDMGNTAQASDKSSSQSDCKTSCCMAFTVISTPTVIPVIKVTVDFQKTATQSPSRFTHINYRPPILS